VLTAGQVLHRTATLFAALDRLRSFLPDGDGPVSAAGRDYLEMAAHDAVRAWKQLCRRLQELEHEATHAAGSALDRAAHALGDRDAVPRLSRCGGDER